jgi:hypothetical protein
VEVLVQVLAGSGKHDDETFRALSRYCSYDKRKRSNFNKTWASLALT